MLHTSSTPLAVLYVYNTVQYCTLYTTYTVPTLLLVITIHMPIYPSKPVLHFWLSHALLTNPLLVSATDYCTVYYVHIFLEVTATPQLVAVLHSR